MITAFLINLGLSVVTAVLDLVPSWSLNLPSITSVGTTIGGAVGLWSGYFPVGVLATCLATLLALRIVLTLWRVAIFVYGILPFKAT